MLKILRLLMGLATIAPVGAMAAADDLAAIEQQWAMLKYEQAGGNDRMARAEALEQAAADLAAKDPRSEALLLQANTLLLTAEIMHSAASLKKVGAARDVLLKADQAQPNNPAVLSTLGSIYYEVPGWPISFGNRKKAEDYLRRAIAIDPDGRDTNFFMGDLMLETNRAGQAMAYLERALAAAQQDTVLDRGRRAEVIEAIEKAKRRARR